MEEGRITPRASYSRVSSQLLTRSPELAFPTWLSLEDFWKGRAGVVDGLQAVHGPPENEREETLHATAPREKKRTPRVLFVKEENNEGNFEWIGELPARHECCGISRFFVFPDPTPSPKTCSNVWSR